MSEKDVITDRYSLLYGDCLERMKEIPDGSVDAVICDPPYGTTACEWDFVIPFENIWKQLKRITKKNGAVAVFGQEPFSSILRVSNIDQFKYDWIWEKERLVNVNQVRKRPGKTVEVISVFYEKQPTYNPQMVKHTGAKRTNKVKNGTLGVLSDNGTKRVKEYTDTGFRYPTQVLKFKRDILTSNLHPTQKPVALLEYLIKTYTNENETVLDFTFGSCSTGVACLNTNRKFIGIEMNEKYFDIGAARMATTMLQLQEVASEQISTEQQENQLNKFFEIK